MNTKQLNYESMTTDELKEVNQGSAAELEKRKGPEEIKLTAFWVELTKKLLAREPNWLPQAVKDLPAQGWPRYALIRKHYDLSETQQANAEKEGRDLAAKY